MNDIMDLSPSERDELLNERPLFEFTAVLTDDRIETEYGNYRYGELLGGFLTFDSYEYAQAYFDMSDAYYEDRQEDSSGGLSGSGTAGGRTAVPDAAVP